MRNYLKSTYQKMKQSYLDSRGFDVPLRYQSSFVHCGGSAEVQYIYGKFFKEIPKKSKILIVGVMGGRDFFMLKNMGFDVTAFDLGPQPEIEPITNGNVEDELPFPPGSFDLVIIGEVLEHLKEDVKALNNVRKVIKENGKLVVTLPFYNDWEDGHMRIHSPKSGERLLQMGGFSVIDFLERPGLFWLIRPVNMLNHGLNFSLYLLTRKSAYSLTTRIFGFLEWHLGHLRFLRPIRRWNRHFGGYYLCQKESSLNHLDINKNLYTGEEGIFFHPESEKAKTHQTR